MRARKEENTKYNMFMNFLQVFIKRLCFILIVVLIISQILFTVEPFNYLLNKSYKLEGKSVSYMNPAIKTGDMELTIQDDLEYTSEIQVLINGEVNSKFHKNSMVLSVKEGDIIEVQGKNIQNFATLKITRLSDSIILPKVNKTFIISNSIEFISKIKFK